MLDQIEILMYEDDSDIKWDFSSWNDKLNDILAEVKLVKDQSEKSGETIEDWSMWEDD